MCCRRVLLFVGKNNWWFAFVTWLPALVCFCTALHWCSPHNKREHTERRRLRQSTHVPVFSATRVRHGKFASRHSRRHAIGRNAPYERLQATGGIRHRDLPTLSPRKHANAVQLFTDPTATLPKLNKNYRFSITQKLYPNNKTLLNFQRNLFRNDWINLKKRTTRNKECCNCFRNKKTRPL